MNVEIGNNMGMAQASALAKENSPAATTYDGIGRLGYWLGSLALAAVYIGSSAMAQRDPGAALFGFALVVVVSFVLTIARLHNIGMSGWWSLLSLVPIASFYVGIKCSICPEGYQDTHELDTAGRILGGIILGSFVLAVVAIMIAVAAH